MATITNDYRIDSLLWGSAFRMNSDSGYGTATTITYSFMTSPPSEASSSDRNGFTAMTDEQKALVRAALAVWAEVANVTFVETTSSNADIQFGMNDQGNVSSAYTLSWGEEADIYFNTRSWESGSTDWDMHVMVHEIGHALGLKHPGNYNAGGGAVDGPYLPSSEDTTSYSVMSYNDSLYGVYPTAPMLYDLLAIQFLYGANTSTRSGNDNYVFTSTDQATIWDGGGTDTIDASGQSSGVVIDLREGYFSSIGNYGNITIGYGAIIENAWGSAHDDYITGNDSANVVSGGAGNDSFSLGNGDYVDGGSGNDSVTISTSGALWIAAVEAVSGSSGSDSVTLASAASITMAAVETVIGSVGGDWVTLADSTPLVLAGIETLLGSGGADSVTLLEGNGSIIMAAIETLTGASDGNWVTLGDRGGSVHLSAIETLLGGAGSDVVFLGGSGSGNTIVMAAIESLTGSGGSDVITTGARGGSVTLAAVESVVGGSGADWVTLGSAGAITLSGVETLLGSAGSDTVTLTGNGGTIILAAVETLFGTSGGDLVSTGARGGTLTTAFVETVQGGSGADWLTLGSAGAITVSGIETLLGSAGTDSAQLGSGGNTVTTAAVETVIGGSGVDVLTLGDRGVVLAVQNVESILGGKGADTISLLGGTATTLRLQSTATGGDSVSGFASGTDHIAIESDLRSAVDADGNGSLTVTVRSGGQVTAGDEVVMLGTTVSTLSDTGYAAFRSALGQLPTAMAGDTLLVIANDGSNSALYAVTPDADGVLDADEVTLLIRFEATLLSGGDLA